MKVLITAIRHQVDAPTGSSRIAHDEANEFARLGHEVWVLASTPEADFLEHEIVGGCHLLRYAQPRLAAWHPARRTAHQSAAAKVLGKYLPEVDLVHGHAPLSYQAALHRYGNSPRKCYTVHSPVRLEMQLVYENDGFWRKLTSSRALAALEAIERECIEKSDAVTALSKFTVSSLANIHGGSVARNITIIPGWVDTEKFYPIKDVRSAQKALGWASDDPVLFTLRRLTPRMGLDRLLQAASGLRVKGFPFKLVIAGDGPLRRELEDKVAYLDLKDRIRFVGRVSDDQLVAMYQACDAFVLPTRALECFGLIAIEALAAGKPVLATPVGAIPEVLRNFEPYWLARSAEVDSLEELLGAFLGSRLPLHDAQSLHVKASRLYGKSELLEHLVSVVQGAAVIRSKPRSASQ